MMTHARENGGPIVSRNLAGVRSRLVNASALALVAASLAFPATVRAQVCAEPRGAARPSGVPASMRVYDQDPAFRDIARGDLLMKQGRRAEAAAIYRRYVDAAPDHRETARRAQLKMAQVALANKDFSGAESWVARATGPGAPSDLVARGKQISAQVAYRRASAAAEDSLSAINPLVSAGRYDEAARMAQALLQKPCPYPVDFKARVRSRLAGVYRARQDYASARAMAEQARASATTPDVRQGATRLLAEIDQAAKASALRAQVGKASDLAEAGNRDAAIAILQPIAARRDVPPEVAALAGLRLAHAWRAEENFPAARQAALAAQARAVTAEQRAAAADLIREIDAAAFAAGLRSQIASANALIDGGNPAGAIPILEPIATAATTPPDIALRARLRLAQAEALAGQFDAATATIAPLLADGTLTAEQRAEVTGVQLRVEIARANSAIDAGNYGSAIAALEPVVARADLPADVGVTARLRLARAYSLSGRHDEARGLIEPLRAGGALDAEGAAAATHIYLARANAYENAGNYAAADPAYRELLAWQSPLDPELRDNARLGLARSLDHRGDRRGAMPQVMLVRADAATPELRRRAVALQADITGDVPPGRLVGYVQAGLAWDSNAPTFVTAQDQNDTETSFPAGQRFSDTHAELSTRLQYRVPLGAGDNTLDLSAYALRTFQFDLSSLDRTRVELSAGPSFTRNAGLTRFMVGGTFTGEWRGGHFRSSEPGLYAGVRTDLGANLSLTAVYTLGFHNDYRPERDGTDHQLDALLRYDRGGADVIRLDLRATREGGKVDYFRNWRLQAGADWTHRWDSGRPMVPFVTLSASAERVMFDGHTPEGIARRDWKLRAEAEAGVELNRTWRASVHYGFYDINSNVPTRDRRPDHQVGVTLRYSWN